MSATRDAQYDLLRRVASLSVWRRGSRRAPHKPLLFLLALGSARRGTDRIQPFSSIEEPLSALLRKYGPPAGTVHPEYPFWWLRSGGFWEVEHAPPLARRRSSNDPTRTSLRAHASGGFTTAAYALLTHDAAFAAKCASSLLRDHFPPSLHGDILADVGLCDLDIERAASRDARFRAATIEAYGHCCAICGFDVKLGNGVDLAIEAAHLKWHQAGGPDIVPNGLALCSIHHKALDLGAVSLDADFRIVISAAAYGHSALSRWFLRFHGRPLRPSHSRALWPDPAFVAWHRREVFRTPARD